MKKNENEVEKRSTSLFKVNDQNAMRDLFFIVTIWIVMVDKARDSIKNLVFHFGYHLCFGI